MEGKTPRVSFQNVEDLDIRIKGGVTKITFEVLASPTDVARIMYLSKQKPPMDITIESPQAQFDLTITPFDVTTGEIAPDELNKRL